MTIDLSADAKELRAAIDKAVEKYGGKHEARASAAAHPPVTHIGFTFWLGDGGPGAPFVLLQLDTRPEPLLDGEWTHAQFAMLKRPGWRSPVNGVCDGKSVTIKLLNGKSRKLTAENMTKTFGEFCVALLKSAKAEKHGRSCPRL